MNIFILCREKTKDVLAIRDELVSRGHNVLIERPSRLILECNEGEVKIKNSHGYLDIDIAIGWTSLHESSHGVLLLNALEKMKIPVYNSSMTLMAGQSKTLNSVILQLSGLPHIKTISVGSMITCKDVINSMPLPLVYKPEMGAFGSGVKLVQTEEELETLILENNKKNTIACFQEVIDKPNRDIRVNCADFKPVFGFYRYAEEGSFITNLSAGGRLEYPINEKWEELSTLSEQAARAFNAPMAGVDLVESQDGFKILEVNTVPGFNTFLKYVNKHSIKMEQDALKATQLFADGVEKSYE